MAHGGIKLDTLAPPRPLDSLPIATASVGLMSPVSQHGCFAFDRIIKAGHVVKRTRKTRSWKPIHLVLRPNCLSMYKDRDETQLRHQINLADITAVARQKDSKKKMDHVFAIFSPARNYHLGAPSDKDAQQWVDLIRAEARIDQDDGDPTSSSSDAERRPSSSRAAALHYSGNERGSVSDFDFSDAGPLASTTSWPKSRPQPKRNLSQQSNIGATPVDERVVCHGWLYVLKSKGRVRQWKRVWLVLRPKGLAFYKSDEEYAATHIIPFSSIIDAVDIDSMSRSKQYCMQVISDEKNFRFCAPNEDSLATWLGAFKSLLIKRKDAQQKQVAQFASTSTTVQTPVKPIASPQLQPPTPTATQEPLTAT
ncbi:hypothetical protein BDU57DRAFT_510434 [Ampelomyces quisqualis]|uniref:PH domain-containing protein n=1 Tax=Ampelomyces quisqualis TaxID=50730 RepID=A0A6A5R0H9_AMPQU|nr:hypothetical protein BDU57DRAFT_510434 [Ampelomyces quisqualis]